MLGGQCVRKLALPHSVSGCRVLFTSAKFTKEVNKHPPPYLMGKDPGEAGKMDASPSSWHRAVELFSKPAEGTLEVQFTALQILSSVLEQGEAIPR